MSRKRTHECCTSSRDLLVARKVYGEQRWRWFLRTRLPFELSRPGLPRKWFDAVQVLHCPWCGKDMAKLVDVPKSAAAE